MLASACGSATNDSSLPSDTLPFDAVLIETLGTTDVDRYRYDIERNAEAELIACMADAGFDFIIPKALPPDPTEAELASKQFVETSGFGIISEFRRWVQTIDVEAQRSDPNRSYLTTLTGSEIQRYLATLDGEPAEPGQIAENAGCRGEAAEIAYADWNRFHGALPNFTAMGEERDTHPDWLAARSEWRECLLDRGYDYSEPEAIRSDVENRMNQSVATVYPDGRVPLVFTDDTWRLDPEVEPLLDELQEFELAAAEVNYACTEPLAERFEAVEREVQQGFVDRNQTTIDELLAASS